MKKCSNCIRILLNYLFYKESICLLFLSNHYYLPGLHVVALIMNNFVVDEDVHYFSTLIVFLFLKEIAIKDMMLAVFKYNPAFCSVKIDKTGSVVPLDFDEPNEPIGKDVKGKNVFQWFSPAVEDDGVLHVSPYGKGA